MPKILFVVHGMGVHGSDWARPVRAQLVEAASRRTESGLGLRAMRERAELVKGRLAVTSVPGSGTTVEAVLPRGDG